MYYRKTVWLKLQTRAIQGEWTAMFCINPPERMICMIKIKIIQIATPTEEIVWTVSLFFVFVYDRRDSVHIANTW